MTALKYKTHLIFKPHMMGGGVQKEVIFKKIAPNSSVSNNSIKTVNFKNWAQNRDFKTFPITGSISNPKLKFISGL